MQASFGDLEHAPFGAFARNKRTLFRRSVAAMVDLRIKKKKKIRTE